MKNSLTARVVSALGITLLATAAFSGISAGTAAASPAQACSVDEPCLYPLWYSAASRQIHASWSGDWDAYNIRWTIHRGRQVQSLPQVDVGGRKTASIGVSHADRGHTYRLSVQGCNRRFLARSVCSPWTSATIVPVPLPYGPDTCKSGYVWRGAFPGDHVCVTPRTRTQAASDNAQAAVRRAPNGGPYGPNTCRSGYVWREARPGDVVCVTPQVRTQTAADNRNGYLRRA